MSAPRRYTIRHSTFDNTWSVYRGENEVVSGIEEESLARELADGLNERAQSSAPVIHEEEAE